MISLFPFQAELSFGEGPLVRTTTTSGHFVGFGGVVEEEEAPNFFE